MILVPTLSGTYVRGLQATVDETMDPRKTCVALRDAGKSATSGQRFVPLPLGDRRDPIAPESSPPLDVTSDPTVPFLWVLPVR